VLAGVNIAHLARGDRVGPILLFVLITGGQIYATVKICGSMSGAGYQEWREAVYALRPEVARTGAPVLFRSGNAEDDLAIGQIKWPATLAPLRSPGHDQPLWDIVLLTYRWFHPERATYFEDVVARRVEKAPVFFMLCLVSEEPGSRGYCDNVEAWVRERFGVRFQATSLGDFRQLAVIRFDRDASRAAASAQPPGAVTTQAAILSASR